MLNLLKQICQTPAPTFHEKQRAQLMAQLWEKAGVQPVMDQAGNVLASLEGEGPRILLAAHLDTVFELETDVSVKEKADRWYAPGIGDNSASLAVLTYYLETLKESAGRLPNLTFAATVGEEGLGNLRGIREILEASRFDMVIAVDGHLGTIVHQAVGSKRFEVVFKARGGHSWGDYPGPSAIHAAAEAVYNLGRMVIPREPRSSFNIGQIAGGSSINAIAERAWFNIDLRSLDKRVLDSLEQDALKRIQRAARDHRVEVNIQSVGDRPAGVCQNAELVAQAKNVLEALNIPVRITASSTDANAAITLGIPSIAFGVYHGGDAHRMGEWLEPDSLETGFLALEALIGRLSGQENLRIET